MTYDEQAQAPPAPRSLGELQALALAAQAVTMLLSVAQSIVVVRLLSVAEFGMVGLALGAGGVLDVLQQFTIQSAAVRELSRDPDRGHAQRVVTVALGLRLLMVLPNALIIYLSAGQVAGGLYGQAALQLPIQIMAITMLVNCGRAVLENTLTGLHAFRTYYVYLICAFVVRLALFWVFVALWRVNGYFWAELGWGCLLTLSLPFLVRPLLGRWQPFVGWKAIRPIIASMLGLSVVLFASRLSDTWWKRGATALMGLVAGNDEVGLFHFGLGFAGQILAVSGALSTIYLPLMSRLARSDREGFRRTLPVNLTQVLVLFWFAVGLLILFSREVVLVMAGAQYLPALPLIPVLLLAFFVQALFAILATSALVPTGNDRWFLLAVIVGRVLSLALFMVGLVWLGGLRQGVWGFFLGLLPGLVLMLWAIRRQLRITLWRVDYVALFALVGVWIIASLVDWALGWRIALALAITPPYGLWAVRRGMIDMRQVLERVKGYWMRLRSRRGEG